MFGKKPSQKKQEKINAVVDRVTSMAHPETDPQGMYTGVPDDPWEVPVQDADDL